MTAEKATKETRSPYILISDRETGLPYSKGLMASQVMVTGLSPFRAYEVAEAIEDRLVRSGRVSITARDLDALTVDVIDELAGDRYARNFRRWRDVEALEIPLVVLIGGATGVGKSTIATQLATRLGIVRVVATDAVREVMRAMLSERLLPTLHRSSFEAGDALREPEPRDVVVAGFREQTSAVAVGLDALLRRAALEGMSMIIEGAHVVPGFVDVVSHRDDMVTVPVIVTVEEEDVHRTHFLARSADHAGRPATRYLDGFERIRRVQRYIKSQALSHGVPVIPNYNFDQALAAVTDLVMQRATDRAEVVRAGADGARGGAAGAARRVEAR
jgi:2-phosphoglycerate kinase